MNNQDGARDDKRRQNSAFVLAFFSTLLALICYNFAYPHPPLLFSSCFFLPHVMGGWPSLLGEA
jgi:hypothetical protein